MVADVPLWQVIDRVHEVLGFIPCDGGLHVADQLAMGKLWVVRTSRDKHGTLVNDSRFYGFNEEEDQ